LFSRGYATRSCERCASNHRTRPNHSGRRSVPFPLAAAKASPQGRRLYVPSERRARFLVGARSLVCENDGSGTTRKFEIM
jgi:hypothetical protein